MKTIPLTDLSTLGKCLAMSTSTNDAEVVVAMRKANAILAKHSFTWEELLRKQVQTGVSGGSDYSVAAAPSDDNWDATKAHIQKCLDALRGVNLGPFGEFVSKMDNVFARTGYLTAAQRKPIFDAYRRHMERTNG